MIKIKFLFFFFYVIISSISNGQQLGQKVAFEKEIKLKGKGQCFFIDKADSSLVLIIDSDYVRLLDISKNEIVKEYSSKKLLLHKRNFLGYSIKNGITLYYGSPNGEIRFSFLSPSNENLTAKVLNFVRPADEFQLATFSENGKFFVLTISKKSSILNFYVFDSFYQFEKKTVDLSSSFIGETLFDELKDETTQPGKLQIKRPNLRLMDDLFDPKIPTTNDLNKLYVDNGRIYITLDGNSFRTKMIDIDLAEFNAKNMSFSQQGSCYSNSIYSVNNSNSYINKGKLYTARSCKEEILVGVYNLNGSKIETLSITEEGLESNSVSFGLFKILDLDNAKRVLKVMSKLDVGLIAQENDSIIMFTVGGHKNYSSTGGGFGGAPMMSYTSTRSSTVQGILNLYDSKNDLEIDDSKYYKLGVRKRGLENSFARFIFPFEHKDALMICYYDNTQKTFKVERFD